MNKVVSSVEGYVAKAFNSTTTKKERWRAECEDWIQAGMTFEVRDIQTEDLIYCHRLCGRSKYKYSYQFRSNQTVAIFSPD
jgi:hypothetical protein